jgi:hypothetical protein
MKIIEYRKERSVGELYSDLSQGDTPFETLFVYRHFVNIVDSAAARVE